MAETGPGSTTAATRAPGRAEAPAVVPALEELFGAALTRLVEETDAETAVAWLWPGGGAPTRITHGGGSDPGDPPGDDALEALFAHGSAMDLREPDVAAPLAEFGRKFGFEAAAPLAGETRLGAIFLQAPVRPRALAALGQVAARLQGPAATAITIARLAHADEELTRVTRLANLGDLLAETVHEIRNPLVSVKTFLQLLPENLDDPDFHTNFRAQVVDEVRRMERLLEAVLLQARPETPTTSDAPRTSIGSVLESVGRLLEKRAQEQRLRLIVDVGADLPPAAIDEDPLRQVILNLALNAFEATREGGCVRLTICRAISHEGAWLQLTVDDEGPGVPEDERERLFEPFFSTRVDRPVGLGLTVCRRIVDRANGSIQVEATPGEAPGARFCVRLPAA